MQSSSFRLISAVVTLLLFVGMVGVVVLVLRTAPAASVAPRAPAPAATAVTAEENPAPTALLLATPTLQLAQTQPGATTSLSVTAGGFSFTPLADYALEHTASAATLTSQSGTIFLLRGGTPEQLASVQTDELDAIFEQFVTFYASRDNFQSRNKQAVQVDGVDGLAVDLVSASTTAGFVGRIVMVQPAPTQLFLLVAVSPAAEWTGAAGDAFQQLVQSIHFFPLTTALAPNPTSPSLTRTPSPMPTASATPSGASIAAILRPTPTPKPTLKATGLVTTPIASLPAASLTALQPGNPNWRVYSNGNVVNDIVVANTMIWAASDGGVGVWNRSNNEYAKFTTLDGLAANRTTTVVDCPLPGFGLVFGSEQGLQIFDTQRNRWKTLNSTNSEMHFDDVSALYCSPEHGFLVVGYARHGIDLYDVKRGWTLLDQRRGLLDNAVKALMVLGDREEIWVASAAGIAVVTESGVMVYDKNNTPLESSPTVMAGRVKGSIWLGAGNKVYRVDGKTWTIYSTTYVLASAFPAGIITSLTLVDDGTLWIGSDQGELCLFDPTVVTCKTFFSAKDLKVTSGVTKTALDTVGRLYVATAGDGVLLHDDKGWHPYRAPEELIASNRVRAFAQDTLGFLWLATDTGLYQIEPAADRVVQRFTSANTTFPVAEITTLYAAPSGGLWVGGKGAAYFDGVQWQRYTKADGLAADRVQAIAGDAQKRIWFGTSEGLSIWNGQSFFTLTRADRLPSNNILTLLADGATMWIGSDAGLLHFEDNRFQIYTTATTELASNRITALAKETDGAILIGTDQGLARWADKTVRTLPETADYPVRAIGLSAPDRIWLGTDGQGVLYFDGTQWTTPPDATTPPDHQIGAIAVDGQGAVWIAGVQGGVMRYVP